MVAAVSKGAPFVFFAAMMALQFFVVLVHLSGDQEHLPRRHAEEL